MSLNKIQLEKLLNLSKLQITNDEEMGLLEDFNKVIDWLEKLNEVDTNGVEPLYTTSSQINVFRNDEVVSFNNSEQLLNVSKNFDSSYFKVAIK